MEYIERKPDAELGRCVECFWVVSDDRRRKRTPERIIPDGCPEWIVHAGDPFARRVKDRWMVQPIGFLAGTLTRPWTLRAGPRVSTLGIRFRPGGVAALLDLNLSDTADREVNIVELLGPRALEMERAIRSAKTPQRMLSIAERHLLSLAAANVRRRPKTLDAVNRLRKVGGRLRVGELAAAVGMSKRTLERTFQRELGLAPKQYARIVRLNAALANIARDDRSRIVDIALDSGYFDEPHLLKEFRALVGRNPRGSRDSDGKLARHFTRPERLRTLLLGE